VFSTTELTRIDLWSNTSYHNESRATEWGILN
jgi:hypothetical protein